jgi:CRISPR-associated protein Cmr4
VDSPIQREKHTGWPKANSTSLRGPIRRALVGKDRWKKGEIEQAFGPEAGRGDLYQAAVGIGDAMLLLLPVRSARHAFVYATCPAILSAFRRRLDVITGEAANAALGIPTLATPDLSRGHCWTLPGGPHQSGHLLLEAFLFPATEQAQDSELAKWAYWIAQNAFPTSPDYFQKKLTQDLVLLHDDDFGYFARRSTVVEAHNRIDDAAGTVEQGGLFYIEHLPAESLLASWVDASSTRAPKKEGAADHPNEDGWLGMVSKTLDGQTLQAGGDTTTGRGLLYARFLTEQKETGKAGGDA